MNQEFLNKKRLKVQPMGHGFAWLDTGTHDSLAEASTFVEVLQKRQGFVISCLEGITYCNGWLSKEQRAAIVEKMPDTPYSQRLRTILKQD